MITKSVHLTHLECFHHDCAHLELNEDLPETNMARKLRPYSVLDPSRRASRCSALIVALQVVAFGGMTMFATHSSTAQSSSSRAPATNWRNELNSAMPLLGHRNWVLVVDSAYPLQTSPGVETIETNSNQDQVVEYVLETVNHSPHVRPFVYLDSELPFVPDSDAPGVSQYRNGLNKILHGMQSTSEPHEEMIRMIGEAGKTFRVLVLKTNMTIPYTSVFIRLDCKYWSDEAEQRLRTSMSSHNAHSSGK